MANLMLAGPRNASFRDAPSIAGLARETRIECDSLRMVVSGTTLGFLTAFQIAQNFHHRQIEISMTVNQVHPKSTHTPPPLRSPDIDWLLTLFQKHGMEMPLP
jgi:hypothetical protein